MARAEVHEAEQYSIDKAGRGSVTPNVKRVSDGALDRLNRTGEVPRRDYQAGHKFRLDSYLAGRQGSLPSVDWSRGGGKSAAFGRTPKAMISDEEDVVNARLHDAAVRRHFRGKGITILDAALVAERSLEDVGREVFRYASQREAALAGRVSVLTMLGVLADFYEALLSGRYTSGRARS